MLVYGGKAFIEGHMSDERETVGVSNQITNA